MWLNNKGNVAVSVALLLPVIIGGAAFGIETGYWRYDAVRLQQAADAAAYAGAVVERADGSAATNSTLTNAATAAATSDGYSTTTDTITVNYPSTATPSDANSVEAVLTRTENPIFTAYLRCIVAGSHNSTCASSSEVIRASATASFSSAGDACILALSPSASKAVDFAGNSAITLSGCSVMSNSLAINAVNVQGSANLTTSCIYAAGGVSQGGTIDLTGCNAVKGNQPPVADPYAAWTYPTTPSGSCKNLGNGSTPVPGKLYCGIDVKTTETLTSGTYFVDSGGLSLEANGNLSCSGCTFVMTDGGGVTMNGNSASNLSAPTSGSTSGMLFVSARGNTATITINGNNTSSMTGAIYAPSGSVSYIGDFAGTNGCTQIVAQTVSWSGNTTFGDNCSAYGMGSVKVGSVVRLSA